MTTSRLLAFCVAYSLAATSPALAEASYGGGSGASLQTAITIDADNEMEGVAAEYDYVKQHLPGWTVASQSVANQNGRSYDVLVIQKGSETRELFFDITAFFGKM